VKTVQDFLSELHLDLAQPPTSPYKMQRILELSGESVLDVGCRDGSYVAFCRALGKRAIGLDLSLSAVLASANPPIVYADAQTLPFPDSSFDTVLMFDVLEHVPDDELGLGEAARVGRKNILLSLPKPDNPRVFNPWNGLTYGHYRDLTHLRYYPPERIHRMAERLGCCMTVLDHWCPVHPADVYIGAGLPRLIGRLADRIMWMLVRDRLSLMRCLFVEVSLGR